MCIIAYKEAGIKLPAKETLRMCFENNPDGAGYMYRLSDNSIRIRKGFMEFDKFYNDLVKHVSDDDEVCMHFRIATHGTIEPGNTHPFPVTRKIHVLRSKNVVCKTALAHNGVMPDLTHRDKTLSDTMCLVKMLTAKPEEHEKIQKYLCNGKFVIMDETETRIYGQFEEFEGVLYSNTTYRERTAYATWSYAYDNKCNLVDWCNKEFGTKFTDETQVERYLDILDICETCVWYDYRQNICAITMAGPEPLCNTCDYTDMLNMSDMLDKDLSDMKHMHMYTEDTYT